jgi:hypothetical protein
MLKRVSINQRQAKIEALAIVQGNVQGAIDSGAAYHNVPDSVGFKIEAELIKYQDALDRRIAKLTFPKHAG